MSGKLDGNTTVGEVLVRHPGTREVFRQFSIDWRETAAQQLAGVASKARVTLDALHATGQSSILWLSTIILR